MPNKEVLEVYRACVDNVRELSEAEKELRKTINWAIKGGKQNTVKALTKAYALLYSTYVEAVFAKTITTPHGFDQPDLDQIKAQDCIKDKWHKCLELAFKRFGKASKGSEIPNKLQELKEIIQKYIIEPSELRNKIAHGQPRVALNRKNTAKNSELTIKLSDINVVQVQRWFGVYNILSGIVKDLIESPQKAHYNWYYTKFQELEAYIKKTSSWTVESKRQTNSFSRPVREPKRS